MTFTARAAWTAARSATASTIIATTNSAGQVSEAFNANTVTGTYAVTASVSGVGTPASFSLTNTAGAAAGIAVASGSPQSATVNTAFTNPLVATVTDQFGNVVPGASVSFLAGQLGQRPLQRTAASPSTARRTAPARCPRLFTANTIGGQLYRLRRRPAA